MVGQAHACLKRRASHVSVGLILVVTAILWRLNSTAAGSYHLVYIYLFPVALIATLYNGRLALLGTAIAVISAELLLAEAAIRSCQ